MNAQTFISAAGKHLADTSLLTDQRRYDNAAYLSGYVVECCLKALLVFDGMPTEHELGHDLPLMSANALTLAYVLAPSRRRYDLEGSPDLDALILSWNPNSRYDQEGTTVPALAESRLKGAQTAYAQIAVDLIFDGLI